MLLGTGDFQFEPIESWQKLPSNISLGEVAAVGVDANDRVYLFNRGPHPVVVLSREGDFIQSWGEGLFPHAHGLDIGPDQTLWLTDDWNHCVRQCSPDGKVLRTIGIPGKPAPYMSGSPFCMCTHTAISPEGDVYVADGYRNACVHKFSPNGTLIRSWGRSGTGPGEFNIVHNIACDDAGRVYVADRENHRIQVFDGEGRFQTQWNNLHRPCALIVTRGPCPLCFVGELPPTLPVNRAAPNLGPRLSVLDSQGQRLATIGDCAAGVGPGKFIAPHGIAFDSVGDLYLADVAESTWSQCFPDADKPSDLKTFHKLRRVRSKTGLPSSRPDTVLPA
jgi:DNA-binding beta-propeller fold protein YncE